MAKLIILGSSNSIPDNLHENTHMIYYGDKSSILIDCPNNPIPRLLKIGISLDQISDIVITHFHPDHVGGLPIFLLDMWLLGRTRSITIHGLSDTLDRVEKLMDLYDRNTWKGFFQVSFNHLKNEENQEIFNNNEISIKTSPLKHMIPSVGIRMEQLRTGKVIAYSSDTEPCERTISLAHQAELLIHEANGEMTGHSSASQAGEIAEKSGANELLLIHYPTGENPTDGLVMDAKTKFSGPVSLAFDLLTIEL